MTYALPAKIRGLNSAYERKRKFAVRWILLIYLLSLLEGPLRKWILPELAGPLTLLRDPFVITLYLYAFANRLILYKTISKLWFGFAAFTALFGLVQYFLNNYGLVGWLLGIRTYWLYMPLAFVVAKTFRREDVLLFLKLNLWLAIPYAILVENQYSAGAFAFINRGVGGDQEAAVGLTVGIVRPFGLFTYTGPNVDFTAAVLALMLAAYFAGPRVRPKWPVFMVMATAVGVMLALAGSRGIFFLAGFIVAFSVGGVMAGKLTGQNLTRIVVAIGLVALGGGALILFFPDMFSAMAIRFERAEQSEGSVWQRAVSGLSFWVEPLFTVPYEGFGIGLGSPGVAKFLGVPALTYGESDLQRNVNELGFFLGLFMLLLRFVTAAFIGRIAVRQAKKGDFVSLPIAGYVIIPIAIGQITHSPISGFLPWLFFGLLLALTSRSQPEISSARP